jgi:hypothetical protein
MILNFILFSLLSLSQACDFPCLRTCESLGNGPSCYRLCDCIEDNEAAIQQISIGWENGQLVLGNVTDAERQWIENFLGCNLDCAQNCIQNYIGEFLIYCLDQCGCKQLIPSPPPQKVAAYSSDVSSITKNIDETDCINLCTEKCSSKTGNLDTCLQECLSKNCKGPINDSQISTLSVLFLCFACVGALLAMRQYKKSQGTLSHTQPLLNNSL